MTRPTKEQVEIALLQAQTDAELVFAAEVRALLEDADNREKLLNATLTQRDQLREEVDATSLKWDEEVLELKQKLARVEALKPAWRSRSRGLRILRAERQIGIAEGLRVCADELDSALRGES